MIGFLVCPFMVSFSIPPLNKQNEESIIRVVRINRKRFLLQLFDLIMVLCNDGEDNSPLFSETFVFPEGVVTEHLDIYVPAKDAQMLASETAFHLSPNPLDFVCVDDDRVVDERFVIGVFCEIGVQEDFILAVTDIFDFDPLMVHKVLFVVHHEVEKAERREAKVPLPSP